MRRDAIQNAIGLLNIYTCKSRLYYLQNYGPGALYSDMLFYKGSVEDICLVCVAMAEQRDAVPAIILITSATSSFSTISTISTVSIALLDW